MSRLIFYFAVFLLAILIGLAVRLDPGYVLIAYYHWSIETSLWVTLGVLLILFFILHKSFNVQKSLSHFSVMWKLKRRIKRLHQPYLKIQKGLLLLLRGDWKKAEKLLNKTDGNQMEAVNFLALAIACARQNKEELLDTYIQKARALAPEFSVEIELFQAKLLLEQSGTQTALIKLKKLQESHASHAGVLKLLKTLYVQLNQWHDLLTILPLLQKQKVVTDSEYDALASTAYQRLFLELTHDLLRLKQFWAALPRAMQRKAKTAYAYCQALLSLQQNKEALITITTFLNKQWDDALIDLYGRVVSGNTEKQWQIAKRWLRSHNQSAALLLTLGRLASRLKQWTTAEDYLASSVSLKESSEAFLAMAYLYMMKGETEKAEAMFRKTGIQ